MSRAISHKIWLYKYIRISLDQDSALLVFKSMVLPYFDYGCIFLTSLPTVCYTKLQVYCNIALRICFKIKNPMDCPVKELYKRANLLPLDLRRIYFQLTTCHRLVFSGKLEILPYSGTRATSAPCIKLPRHRLTTYIQSPSYQSASRWNALDPELRWLSEKNEFKVNIKRRLGLLFIHNWRHDYPNLLFDGTGLINGPEFER